MLISAPNFDIPWLDLLSLAAAFTLFEGAITGRGRTYGRGRVFSWPVRSWLRPIFAIVGFGLLGFALIDLIGRLAK
jgi:hypothetical protein